MSRISHRFGAGARIAILIAGLGATALFSLPTRAEIQWPGLPGKRLFVGAGLLTYDLGSFASKPTSATSLGAIVLPELTVSGRFDFGTWGVTPLLALTPIGHGNPEGGVTTRVLRLEARGKRKLAELDDRLEAIASLGLVNAIMSGSGGTVKLNNGNGETTFGLPNTSSTSRLLYIGLGAAFALPYDLRADGEIFLAAPLGSGRFLSFVLSLTYGVI